MTQEALATQAGALVDSPAWGALQPDVWTPQRLPGFVAFLDGLSLAPLGAGAAIDSWAPLGGDAGYAVTGTTTARPVVNASLNGATFDGTDDSLAFGGGGLAYLQNQSAITLYLAVSGVAASYRPLFFASNGDSATTARLLVPKQSATQVQVLGRRLDADSSQNLTVTQTLTTGVLATTIDYSARTITLYLDGAQVGQKTDFQTAGSTSNTASLAMRLGRDTATSLSGTMHGVVLCRGAAHNAATVAQATAWLRARYGI